MEECESFRGEKGCSDGKTVARMQNIAKQTSVFFKKKGHPARKSAVTKQTAIPVIIGRASRVFCSKG
jgi:hypothetical protein